MSEPVVAPSPANVIAAGAVWPALCLVTVFLRFYARRVLHTKIMLDDWLTIPALLLTIGMGSALIVGVHRKSLAYPTPPPIDPKNPLGSSTYQLRTTRQVLWAFELMQIPALGSVKLSFVFFYRRCFCKGKHATAFNTITSVTIALIIAWAVSLFFALLFACRSNFKAWWTSVEMLNTECVDTLTLENAFAISDFITDLIVIVLPLPQIWKLHMTIARRLALVGIFSLGALTVAASITRMVIFIEAVESLKRDFKASGDNDLVTTAGLYWSMIESGLGLLAACLPTLYGLFKQHNTSCNTRSSQNTPIKSAGKYPTMTRPRADSTGSDIEMVSHAEGQAGNYSQVLKEPEHVLSTEPKDGQILVQKTFETVEAFS